MTARKRTTILLVAGDETAQHLRAMMLRLRGHAVERATDPGEALQKLGQKKYSLVIVDSNHPEGAVEFCEEVKERMPGQKLAVLANNALYVQPASCPDDVISRHDGPEQFLIQVESLLAA